MIDLEKYTAGNYKEEFGYRYFIPSFINEEWIWTDSEINQLLEKAAVKLGELNSFARLVPDIDLFIQLHVTKEAVISSKIEGTQTDINEALLPVEEIKAERKDDWEEVNSYIKALNNAIRKLDVLPISSRLLKQTHAILLDSVREEHRLPGEFRTSQNWIGGNSLSDAVFIPPHHKHIPELMSDLEHFLHNKELQIPALIQIAIAHYQFETIHPFLDGNGRIGRLLITLFLVSEQILEKPLCYPSAFFENNKGLYYDNLTFVRTKHDMKQWLKYFLVGIEQTATEAAKRLSDIIELKTDMDHIVSTQFGRRSQKASQLLDRLFEYPFVTVNDVAAICKLSYKAANDLVVLMTEKNILTQYTGQGRNRKFAFEEYLKIFY